VSALFCSETNIFQIRRIIKWQKVIQKSTQKSYKRETIQKAKMRCFLLLLVVFGNCFSVTDFWWENFNPCVENDQFDGHLNLATNDIRRMFERSEKWEASRHNLNRWLLDDDQEIGYFSTQKLIVRANLTAFFKAQKFASHVRRICSANEASTLTSSPILRFMTSPKICQNAAGWPTFSRNRKTKKWAKGWLVFLQKNKEQF